MKKASKYAFFFNIATFGFSFLFPALGIAGLIFLIVATTAGMKLVLESQRLLNIQSETQASKVFLTSAPYLTSPISALIIDKLAFVSVSLIHP